MIGQRCGLCEHPVGAHHDGGECHRVCCTCSEFRPAAPVVAVPEAGEGQTERWVPVCPHCGNDLPGSESLGDSRRVLAEHLAEWHPDAAAPSFGPPMTVARWRREQRSRPYLAAPVVGEREEKP